MPIPRNSTDDVLEEAFSYLGWSGGVWYAPQDHHYYFRAFKCDAYDILMGFNWPIYLHDSFYECFKPMQERFMKVI